MAGPDRLQTGPLGAVGGEPAFGPRFAARPNALLQPHRGSATVETRKAVGARAPGGLKAHFEGRPLLTPVL